MVLRPLGFTVTGFWRRASNQVTPAWLYMSGLCLAAGMGVTDIVRHWERINGDGVSYLEMGEALLDSGMTAGYTGYWAPLYGVLGALAARWAESFGMNRLVGVQTLNAAIFLAGLGSSIFFARTFLEMLGIDWQGWRGALTQLFSAAVFSLLVIRFGGTTMVTPDLGVSALVLVAGAWTLRGVQERLPPWKAGATGLVFGLGYWFKSIFFPLWWLWVSLVLGLSWNQRSRRRWIFPALVAWSLLAVPLTLFISRAAGKLSFGENGKLAILWYVNGLPNRYWQGDASAPHGRSDHPIRKVHVSPAIYEFSNEFPRASYAPWYDPAYWYSGARVRLSPAVVAGAVKANLKSMRRLWLSRILAPFTLLTIIGLWTGRKYLKKKWLAAVIIFALGPFALVLVHTEPRFFYGQVVILMTAGMALLLCVYGDGIQGWGWQLAGAALILWAFAVCAVTAVRPEGGHLRKITEAVQSAGVRAGMKVCTIAQGAETGAWAWYGRVRVVAEMPLTEYRKAVARGWRDFGEAEASFKAVGCDAAIAVLEAGDAEPSWEKTGYSHVYVKLLREKE
jgi:hypothetical protein